MSTGEEGTSTAADGTGASHSASGDAQSARLAAHLAGVEAVLLDIDHTLVDTAAAFTAALRSSLIPMLRARTQARVSGEPSCTSGRGASSTSGRGAPSADERAIIARWSADPGDHYRSYTRGEVPYDVQRHARVDDIARWLGLAAFTDAEYEEFARAFDAAFVPSCAAFDDARPAVLALRDAGVAVGAVSNASRSLQERKLEAAGLADVVPLLVTVETFGVGKPDPRVFREGARLLGADPAHTAYVGDEPDVDAQAAALAGLRGVLLRRPTDERSLEHREIAPDQRRYCEVGDLTGAAAAIALPTGVRTG